jgi:hypothetical protein
MMKADVGAPVEGDRLIRRLDLPQGGNLLAVRDECRGIFRPLANDAPPRQPQKKRRVLSRSRTLKPT